MELAFTIYFLNAFILVYCGYPPTGDEVQPGSVLLPASRRGRYLANIVRRQAVDGTGIKFNKDADRMNAEAKKKVDVLSEELLPYIIAEQERRTTLYKRVMTAIQNGEKGVTVAEIRNKPPLIIRKGLMYRCPSNRAPKEPDGSGTIMCEDEIEPTPVMYDSCLSAEDKELYVAENKYFFCNRHKVEGPDLPRNGSTVIGCAPLERTSLNYTTQKCALEDTDDVVVHFRYYPDRTYKFVTELDPDREVCDHWNPCQIGYIYSLPSPDQAMPANELWHDYVERPDEYEKDEFIPAIPEDTAEEFVNVGESYQTNMRKVLTPPGFQYHGVGRLDTQANSRMRLSVRSNRRTGASAQDSIVAKLSNIKVSHKTSGRYVTVQMSFEPFTLRDAASYYLRFQDTSRPQTDTFKYVDSLLVLHPAQTHLKALTVDQVPGQQINTTIIPLRCNRCALLSVMLRGDDGAVLNLDSSKFRMKSQSGQQKYIEIDLDVARAQDFGEYFAILQNEDGSEEKMKLLSLKAPESGYADSTVELERLVRSLEPGAHFDASIKYACDDCELTDVMCNGESVLAGGRVTIVPAADEVVINFASFKDENACVYIGIFKEADKSISKEIAVIENASPDVQLEGPPAVVPAPPYGDQFERKIPFKCDGCAVLKVTVNGVQLDEERNSRRFFTIIAAKFTPRTPCFLVQESVVHLRFPFFSAMYVGIVLITFSTPKGPATKNVMEISISQSINGDAAEPVITQPDSSDGTATSSAASETASIAATETASSASLETASGAASETASIAATETASSASLETASGAASETASGAATETISGTVSETASGAATETASGAASETASGTALETASSEASETVSGAASEADSSVSSSVDPNAA